MGFVLPGRLGLDLQLFLGSIPSPSRANFEIGPLRLNAYGLCIAIGAMAAVSLATKRWVRAGGLAEDMAAIAWWSVPAGVIGARLYHLLTDWKSYRGNWGDAYKIWDGGLGIWGGVILGVIVGLTVGRKRNLKLPGLLDAVAPALPLAQAIGRWGNWFNIELFGGPSKLPWALEVPLDKRPDGYEAFETFHPAFLYEFLWNLFVVGLVLFVGKRFGNRLKPGRLFAVYVAGYTFGRFWIERMRTDPAYKLLGFRINEWTAGVFFLLALAFLFTGMRALGATANTSSPDERFAVAYNGDAEAATEDNIAADIENSTENGIEADIEDGIQDDIGASIEDGTGTKNVLDEEVR
jgi:prolipoprotein diacylglyceryl transferase